MTDYDKKDVFWRDCADLPGNPYKLARGLEGFRCLLVFPTKKGDISRQYYPTPIGQMASLVRMNGGRADILVLEEGTYPREELRGRSLIAIFPMAASLSWAMRMLPRIKADEPGARICFFNSDQHQHEMLLCGPAARGFAEEMMRREPAIDFVLVGEAESSFLRLAERIHGGARDFEAVPSCAYREGAQVRFSARPIEPVDFRFLPLPARDHLEQTIGPGGVNTSSPRIQASRGCLSPCSYCAESWPNITRGGRKKPLLLREIKAAVDEIELLHREYGVVFFNSIDSSFEDCGAGPERMRRFCEEIEARGIRASFKIHMRAETAAKLDESLLALLKRAGIDVIGTGVESGVAKELRSYRKIATAEQSRLGISRLLQGDFFIILGHMMFSPILELRDLREKAAFLRELHYGWDYLSWSNNVVVHPGTAYHDYLRQEGLALPHDSLAPRIPYRYRDERVRVVAEVMGGLKAGFPETMQLHQLLYDSLNILARFKNKINEPLWGSAEVFARFKTDLLAVLGDVEALYAGVFQDAVEAVEAGPLPAPEDVARRVCASRGMRPSLQAAAAKAQDSLDGLFSELGRRGLGTERLYLNNWFSMRDSQNTAGGKNA